MLKTKKTATALAALSAVLANGCHTVYYQTEPVAIHRPHSGYMVVNNTGVLVNVIQDGYTIARRIEPGQVVTIEPVWLRTTCVVAVGYTADGDYVGSNEYTFQSNVRETWNVNYLVPPHTPGRW